MSDSSTSVRVETIEDSLSRVLAKLDTLSDRVGDLRVTMAEIRADVANVRALVDGVHSRADKIEVAHAEVVKRIDELEKEQAERRGADKSEGRSRALAAAGSGAAGSGALYGVIELLRGMLGG